MNHDSVPLLKFHDVAFGYKKNEYVLRNLKFCLRAGEKVALLGANGAGKSTLFQLCNGLLKPQQGYIEWRGIKVEYQPKFFLKWRQDVALVLQDPTSQIVGITVWDDILYGPLNLGFDEKKAKEQAEYLLKKFSLYNKKDSLCSELSYGMQKKVSILSALVITPTVLLLDEPTAGLDPAGTEELLDVLEEYQKENNRTLVISTHDLELARYWAERVIVLDNQQIIADNHPSSIFSDLNLLEQSRLLPFYVKKNLKQNATFSCCVSSNFSSFTSKNNPKPLPASSPTPNFPALLIAAPRSGEGKTSITLGILHALTKQGIPCQAFKVGPDYLDTACHTHVLKRPSYNLDLWLQSVEGMLNVFEKHALTEGINIVEGVMGLFDGQEANLDTSSAAVAKILNIPVILIVDASKAAQSLAALVYGFAHYDPDIKISGVIFNKWREGRNKNTIEQAMQKIGIPVLGYIPPLEASHILASRHLGLMNPTETQDFQQKIDNLSSLIQKHCDLSLLFACAQTPQQSFPYHLSDSTKPSLVPAPQKRSMHHKLKIGVSNDKAFLFVYADNLELLEAYGFEVVFVSPLADSCLPADLCGLYLAGGYPELYAKELAQNTAFMASVRTYIEKGLPTLAECGGFMYLCQSLEVDTETSIPLVGCIPGTTWMQKKLVAVGYRECTLACDTPLGPKGTKLRGHEFHYSTYNGITNAFECAFSPQGIEHKVSGYATKNLLASYLHIHFEGAKNALEHWLSQCEMYATTRRLNQ